MELKSRLPDAVVIGQDDQSEIHVQAVIQGGRRHVDTRTWRRGPAGFAPGRTGLTLGEADLATLQAGIAELLEASHGGRTVARVVWDDDHGRRLRAEIEPFGTRHVARFGFWQRVRDTWRPADDGLTLAADRLEVLRDVLDTFRLWLAEAQDDDLSGAQTLLRGPTRVPLDPWPPAGADWLTVEPDRIAFHPRHIRITCSLLEQNGHHRLLLQQWRRQDSLWLPEIKTLTLTIVDLDRLLSSLLKLAERHDGGEPESAEQIACEDGSTVRIAISADDAEIRTLLNPAGTDREGPLLRVEWQAPPHAGTTFGFEPCLVLPASYLRWLGRTLTQSWSMLIGWLSDAERAELQEDQAREPPQADLPPDDRLDVPPSGQDPEPGLKDAPASPKIAGESRPAQADSAQDDLPTSAKREPRPQPAPGPPGRPDVPLLLFASEAPTPGTILLGSDEVRIELEMDGASAAGIALPIEALPRITIGLDELCRLCRQQTRVDPVLLYDQRDCAVYARVGTLIRPDAVELRVWQGHTTSAAITFESAYLPELTDRLHWCLHVLGEPIAPLPVAMRPPADLPLRSNPARRRPIAPSVPLRSPGPIVSPDAAAGDDAANRILTSVALGVIQIGRHHVALSLQRARHRHTLVLQWEGNTLDLPADHLGALLTDLRRLYYEALRGRRGQVLTVGEYPFVTITVHSEGGQLCFVFQQEIEGESTSLSFPASEIPTLLDAARAAL